MSTGTRTRGESRAALIVFCLWLGFSAATLLLIGRGQWAAVDDWMLSATRNWSDPASLLRDHNQHFSLVPVLIYKTMFSVIGFSDYGPYRLVGVAIHLGLVMIVRVFIRRIGVGPWIATATAGSLALFNGGPLVLAQFQMPLGLLLGWGVVLIAMRAHVGAWAMSAGIGLGLLAIATSGVALPMLGAAGVIAWRRHGLRRAIGLTVPVGVVYVAWWIWDSPQPPALSQWHASVEGFVTWIVRGVASTTASLAGVWPLAVLVGFAVGAGLLTVRRRRAPIRLLEPTVVALAVPVLLGLSYFGRGFDPSAVTQNRFLYLSAAMLLPLVAAGWQGLAIRHWAWGSLIAVPLAVGVLMNVQALREETEVSNQLSNYQRVLVAAMLRSPAAQDTPAWVRPWWSTGFFGLGNTTWGYLRDAQATGRLSLDDVPVPPAADSAAIVRLRVVQLGEGPTENCRTYTRPLVRTVAPGVRIGFRGGGSNGQSSINVRLAGAQSWPVDYSAGPGGDTLLVVGKDPLTGGPLRVEFRASQPGATYSLCH